MVVDVWRATVPASRIGDDVDKALQGTPDIAEATSLQPTSDGKLLVGTVTPSGDPPQSAAFPRRLDRVLPHVHM